MASFTRRGLCFVRLMTSSLFVFDYGDDWRFVVDLIGFGRLDPKASYPKRLKQEGASPEQYEFWDDEESETR